MRRDFVGMCLILAGLVWWREVEWWNKGNEISSGMTVNYSFRLAEPVKATEFNCVISYMGQTLLINQALCQQSELKLSQVGDEIVVMGVRDKWVKVRQVQVNRVEPGLMSYWWWMRKMMGFKNRIIHIYNTHLPEPESSLVAGIVLGEQGSLPTDFKEALRLTGTTHVVAASGYNVAVVAGVASGWLVSWLGRRKGLAVTGLVIWAYVMLAGGNPPVVRSGLMGITMLLGVIMGREYWSGWGLVVVSGIMLVAQPWLIASVSFQLSLAATAGMIWGSKPTEKIISLVIYTKQIAKHPSSIHLGSVVKILIESLSTTVAAVIMTAPISLIAFGQVSWWGILVNPLILWLIPPLMYLGGVMAVSGLVWSSFGVVMAWLVAPLAIFMVKIIEWTGGINVELVTVPINWWVAGGWWIVWMGVWKIRYL